MVLLLDLSSARPLYRQIYDQVVQALAAGRLMPGGQLPTVRRLAADLSVNLHTVRRAYGLLAEAGLISLERHNGARVLAMPPEPVEASAWFSAELRQIMVEGLARGLSPSLMTHLCRQAVAGLDQPLS